MRWAPSDRLWTIRDQQPKQRMENSAREERKSEMSADGGNSASLCNDTKNCCMVWGGKGSCDSNSSTCINLAALCWSVFLQSPTEYNPVIELFSFWKCCLVFLPTFVGCLVFKEVHLWQGKRSRIFIRIRESVKWELVQESVFWHLGYPVSITDRVRREVLKGNIGKQTRYDRWK